MLLFFSHIFIRLSSLFLFLACMQFASSSSDTQDTCFRCYIIQNIRVPAQPEHNMSILLWSKISLSFTV